MSIEEDPSPLVILDKLYSRRQALQHALRDEVHIAQDAGIMRTSPLAGQIAETTDHIHKLAGSDDFRLLAGGLQALLEMRRINLDEQYGELGSSVVALVLEEVHGVGDQEGLELFVADKWQGQEQSRRTGLTLRFTSDKLVMDSGGTVQEIKFAGRRSAADTAMRSGVLQALIGRLRQDPDMPVSTREFKAMIERLVTDGVSPCGDVISAYNSIRWWIDDKVRFTGIPIVCLAEGHYKLNPHFDLEVTNGAAKKDSAVGGSGSTGDP